MEFKKYKSISKTYDAIKIRHYKQLFPDGFWYITEKIHGTNFSFISDGVTVQYAQRSGILTETDSLFNYQANVHKLNDKILALAQEIGEPIQVYCEYYGKGIVGKGNIDYRSDDERDFIAYDILLLNQDKFISFPDNFNLLDKFEIPRVMAMYQGTLDECLTYSPEFNSFLNENTHAEGIVIKPIHDLRDNQNERLILKNVSTKFAETKLSKSELKHVNEKKEEMSNRNITEEATNKRLTDVRVGKVAAKFGISNTEKNKFGILITELTNDIIEEAKSEESLDLNLALVKQMCVPIVKSFFINTTDESKGNQEET